MPKRTPPRKAVAKPPSAAEGPDEYRFEAKLVRLGGLFGVEVPASVSRSIGVRGHVPVIGTVNGVAPLDASLIPRGVGRHGVHLNGRVREAASAELGQRVTLSICVQRNPPAVTLPEDVAEVLREEGVLATFEAFAYGKRRHILAWIDEAVHEETRAKRIAKVVQMALAKHEAGLDRAAAKALRSGRSP